MDEDEEEEVRQQAKIPEPLNRSRGAGTTAKVKKGDFILPHVDDADLANENEDVSLTGLARTTCPCLPNKLVQMRERNMFPSPRDVTKAR